MKKIILFSILLIISFNVYSQNYDQRLDSLEFEIKKMGEKQVNIINQIHLHQKMYRIGAFVSITGIGISIFSTFFLDYNNNSQTIGIISGGVLGISGYIISLNSFKFLNKNFNYSDYSKSRYEIESMKTSRYDE